MNMLELLPLYLRIAIKLPGNSANYAEPAQIALSLEQFGWSYDCSYLSHGLIGFMKKLRSIAVNLTE